MRTTIGGVWFGTASLTLTLLQASCMALAGAGRPRWADRLRSGAWAVVLPVSIVVVVWAVAVVPATADALTRADVVLIPAGAALAFGWAARGARPWLAAAAVPLFLLAWASPHDRAGQIAAALLIGASAITLGRLIAGVAPLALLKLGVVALAVIDAYLVFSGSLEHPSTVLNAAAPGGGLPQFQSAHFAGAGLGYGDFLAAAVVGAILAVEGGPRIAGAAAMMLVTLAWDQLFLTYDVIPATIPPAVVLIGAEVWRRRRARDRRPAPAAGPSPAVRRTH